MKLLLGDCLEKLKELDDNSVDSIVTDPPYGLSFMGKKWDYDVPSVEIWKECLRVLKPGGHLLSFAGSRTYHRMAVRIEDAGFEIRDQIMWIYGSGFPKSLNIGKAVDKIQGNEREVGKLKFKGGTQLGVINDDNWKPKDVYESKGNTEWEGWGTALKPAHEPIVMARKPLSEKTVVDNVLEWGTGGINIDGCRIELNGDYKSKANGRPSLTGLDDGYDSSNANIADTIGRFPANVIFDEEAGKILDEQSGFSESTSTKTGYTAEDNIFFKGLCNKVTVRHNDAGGASRFFYCPKTSKSDRSEGNIHPTVKPTDLMLYLIRLVTKNDGTILDPFMGSGSTGKAAIRGGFDFIGIEREKEYFEISKTRIEYEKNRPVSKPIKGNRVEVKPEVKEKINQFFDLKN
jgi:site-specific DNA-methyltransferase (adenine-specific)